MAEGKRLSRLAQRARALDSGPGALKAAQGARNLLPGDSAYGDALSIGEGQRPGELFARYLAEVSKTPSASRELGLGAMQVMQSLSESRGRGRGQENVASSSPISCRSPPGRSTLATTRRSSCCAMWGRPWRAPCAHTTARWSSVWATG